MKLFRCYAKVEGTKYLGIFKAVNANIAEEKAYDSDQASINLCYECSEECEDAGVTDINIEEITKDDINDEEVFG